MHQYQPKFHGEKDKEKQKTTKSLSLANSNYLAQYFIVTYKIFSSFRLLQQKYKPTTLSATTNSITLLEFNEDALSL